MSDTVHTHAVTVTFADAYEPRTKVRKCTLAKGQSATEWAKGHFVRPVKSAKAVALTPKPVQEAKPAPASKPAPVDPREAEIAALRAKLEELTASIAAPAPVAERKPRVTQTRAERKASAAKAKASAAKPATMHRHDEAMSNPTYAKAYNAALDGTDGKDRASHVTATMRAWKAMTAEFEASTRKAGKGRKAA